MNDKTDNSWLRITALWALNETALGGILHALHIPLTGYLVGGIAVLCIGLIAHLSHTPSKDLIKSLILVLILKAGISPHSPPAAYIAVCFQGLWASLIFRIFSFSFFSAILFILPAMLESAFQKLLMLTIVYSVRFWEAVDNFGHWLAAMFHVQFPDSLSFWVILIYGLTYVIWGILLSYWLIKLPGLIEKRKNFMFELTPAPPKPQNKPSKMRSHRVLIYVILLIGTLIFLFPFRNEGNIWMDVFFLILRSVTIVSMLLLLQPLILKLIRHWTRRKRSSMGEDLEVIHYDITRIRSLAFPLYKKLKQEHKGIRLIIEWVSYLFVFALYPPASEN